MAFDKWVTENKEIIQKAVRNMIEQDYRTWLKQQDYCTDELLAAPIDKRLEALRTQEVRASLRKIEDDSRQIVK